MALMGCKESPISDRLRVAYFKFHQSLFVEFGWVPKTENRIYKFKAWQLP
jgi:hypothetical protein